MGPRTHLEAAEARAIAERLSGEGASRDLALFLTGVDTMLRASDLLALRVRDVASSGGTIRERLQIGQRKTRSTVRPTLTPRTRRALSAWLRETAKRPDDFLFTARRDPHGPSISASHYRDLVKDWTAGVGLDPASYSTHSLRRTKPVWMWRHGDRRRVTITVLQLLLGHKSPESTIRYLGLDVLEAQDIALAHDLFASSAPSGTPAKMKKR